MGGSGGGSYYPPRPDKMKEVIKEAKENALGSSFFTELAQKLKDLLAEFNTRDENETNKRINEIKGKLNDEFEGSIDSLFGGSVAKHTYVDGLSDIDSLLILKESNLKNQSPQDVLTYLGTKLDTALTGCKVEVGKLAITIDYNDGMKLQILPSIKSDEKYLIPSASGDKWSKINPKGFTNALTKWNEKHSSKLIPTIKLAKAMIAQLPNKSQLTGYHIESIAINAFKQYDGPKDPVNMVAHFFTQAKALVLSPIKDKTGQSVHVDDYLGKMNSDSRRQISKELIGISKKLDRATVAKSTNMWLSFFGD